MGTTGGRRVLMRRYRRPGRMFQRYRQRGPAGRELVQARPGLAGVTNFFDTAKIPMSLGAGPTWIVLAPAGTRTSQTGG